MNFKTTLVLLAALLIVGVVVLFRGGRDDRPANVTAARVLDVDASAVTSIKVAPASGETIALAKGPDGKWSLAEPVRAAAESFEADDLVRAVTSLQSRGQVSAADAVGLDAPRFTVTLLAGDKTHVVRVGEPSAVGENLYVRVDGNATADVVDASLIEQLRKPTSAYRQAKLVAETSDQITAITIARGTSGGATGPAGVGGGSPETISLAKDASGKWAVTAPTAFPADADAVGDLLDAVTGLRAEEFVTETADPATLGPARLTVSFSTAPPTTQPSATTLPARTITFGRFADVTRKGVLVASSSSGAIARVPAAVLERMSKRPRDLRDKDVLRLDPSRVGTVELAIDTAATTRPSTAPAVRRAVVLTRRPPAPPAPIGPALPTTVPTTGPGALATTSPSTAPADPATQPAVPPSAWLVATDGGTPVPANDATVDALLARMNPLRAEKIIDAPPLVATPAGTIAVTVVVPPQGPSLGERHALQVLDFGGNDAAPVVTYNGLTFEAPLNLLPALRADFTKPPAAPTDASPLDTPAADQPFNPQ